MSTQTRSGFYKKMLTLAIPIALQQLLTSCAQLIDTAMVVGLGNVSTAAIGVAGRWGFLINLALFGISSGVATLTAQHWGVKDLKNIRKAYGTGLVLAIAVGLIYTVCTFTIPNQMMMVFNNEPDVIEAGAQYLRNVSPYGLFLAVSLITSTTMRSTEDVNTPLICSFAAVLTNTVLNYILINGKLGLPALGLKGAAIATATSMALQAMLLVIIGLIKKGILRAKISEFFDLEREFFKKFLRVCLPVMFNELLWGLGTNVYAMVYARQGSENYAAYTIFNSIEQIAFVFFVGICHACSIMVGKSVGAGRQKEAYNMGKRFVLLVPLLGVFAGVLLIAFRYPLLSLLPIETEGARQMTATLILIYSLWIGVRNIPYVCIVGIFRAGGDTKIGMYYDLFSLFVLSIPIVVYLGFFTDVPFWALLVAMYLAEDTVKAILCLHRFKSRRWIKQLTFAGDNPAEESQ
ncbi:MAG: MATE family efflux transporter [Clostridia bacterium]|nr:MATE family efflux transporter [Clostridia bacterium]